MTTRGGEDKEAWIGQKRSLYLRWDAVYQALALLARV